MATIETATADQAAGICRVCTAGWQDAYTDVLPAEYIEANIRLTYQPERIADQITESDEGNEDDESNGDNDTNEWVVALDDANEEVVGAVRDNRLESGVREVSRLYVHPDWQGEGIGSQLLTSLTERQRERGATEQRVYVFADHDDAIGFYDSKGFDADERLEGATVDGVEPNCEVLQLSRSI